MAKVYLDQTEMALLETGHGFTGSIKPKPEEGLVTLIEIDEGIWNLKKQGDYLVCRRKDGKEGAYDEYVKNQKKHYGSPD